MTDRDLLELAAKAAGMRIQWDEFCDGYIRLNDAGIDIDCWDPLEDDGDALRLAISCLLTVCMDGSGTVSAHEAYLGRKGVFVTQSVSECGSKRAATRRAIVRAAAGIVAAPRRPLSAWS